MSRKKLFSYMPVAFNILNSIKRTVIFPFMSDLTGLKAVGPRTSV